MRALMSWSWRIGSFAEIPVKIHWTFVLMFLGSGGLGYFSGDWKMAVWYSSLIIAIFTCVVLHEFGHALTARRYGVKTRDIILSPIGGIARLERLPEKPLQEFYVAAAGPMVNLGICIFLIPFLLYFAWEEVMDIWGFMMTGRYSLEPSGREAYFFPILFWLNISLAAFNLLPAFPMDGGRILRSLLSIKIGRLRATKVASYIGQVLAVGLVVLGIYQDGGFVTSVIGVFVFIMASQEYRIVRFEKILSDSSAREVMRDQFTRILPEDEITVATNLFKIGIEKNFLVFDQLDGGVIGVLHETDLLEVLKKENFSIQAKDIMQANFEKIDVNENLKDIFDKMQTNNYSILPIFEEDQLIGIADTNTINNFVNLQSDLKK